MNTLTDEEIEKYCFYRSNGIKKGFFLRYFHFLKTARTNYEAFHDANMEFFDLFGEQRFSTMQSFRNSLTKYLKNETH